MPPTPEGVSDPVRAMEVRQRALESRVATAENAVARMWALLVGVLLVAGQLAPFLTYADDGDQVTPSLLSFGYGGLTYRDEDGHRDTYSLLLGIAFAGLSLLTLVALVSLLGILQRAGSRTGRNGRAPIAALLVIGLVGAWLTVLLALSRGSARNPVHLHAGLPVFTLGVVLYAWLVLSEAGRDLWAA